MAYYDFDGRITIDEQAARRDIRRIASALPYLEMAKSTLDRLLEEGGHTQGETGSAIVDKTGELQRDMLQLLHGLNETRDFIERTVRHYQRLDQEVKEAIREANLKEERE